MRRVRRPALCCALFLLVAACTGEEAEGPPEESFVVVDSPIVGIVPAAGIDEEGRPVDPALVFPSDAPRITVVVRAGKVDAGSLEIAWYRVTREPADTSTAMKRDGDPSISFSLAASHRELLFTHAVEVESFQAAFSVGKNPGTLAPGSYQVEATLEGATGATGFEVRDPDDSPTGAAGQGATGGPPTSGESGLGPPTSEVITETPVLVTWLDYAPIDPNTPEIAFSFVASVPGGRGRVVATATMGGTTRTVSVPTDASSVAQAYLAFRPCAHPGGSDLPRAQAEFAATLYQGETVVTKDTWVTGLGRDTAVPGVTINSSPPAGSRVEPGDEINLDATAQEDRDGPSWQTGLESFRLIATPGGPIGSEQRARSSSPQPCSRKQWSLAAQESYHVPDDAPAIIKICGRAVDFAGNFSDPAACNEYYTEEVWKGRFVWEPSTCPGCTITYNVSLEIGEDGTASGTATYVSCTRCDPPPQRIDLTATRTAGAFRSFAGGRFPHQGSVAITGDRAVGTTTQTFSGITERYNWDLTCVSCDA